MWKGCGAVGGGGGEIDEQYLILKHFQPFHKQGLNFTCLQDKSFENNVGKGEKARNEQLLLFPQCFLTIWRTVFHFHQI